MVVFLLSGVFCARYIFLILPGFPMRIALGDVDEDDGNYRDDEPDGGHPAAHAVEIKKVEQGTERLGAGAVEKKSSAELAHENRDQYNPSGHYAGAHHGNQNAAKRCQESSPTGDGGFFELLVDLNDRAADSSHPVGQETSDVGD